MLLRVFAEEAFSVGRRIGPERPFISQMSLDPPRHVSEPHWCRWLLQCAAAVHWVHVEYVM